ncbi:hypothetical protein KFL_007390040 [Klebsormidium nitens]|uniref:DUF659 domain-containing protein n=1 Tax=Klebsormidium nitens TaxID=105231 RepID=A0A1Y1IK20_KLENI|nr:hypothetical protein KFL_007390040 [Klebsormidium nitens]|eukprot:GAQ91180.1 hypothetical protein KFL_007390040 [Klebsormidium nitens]
MAPSERAYEWDLVAVLEDRGNRREPRVSCNYCGKEMTAGATRIRAHILGIKPGLGAGKCTESKEAVPPEVRQRLQKTEDEKEQEEQRKRRREQLQRVASSAQSSLQASGSGRQSSIQSAFARADKSEVDRSVARFFYANGIPFNVARNPFFKEAVSAIAAAGNTYKPPGSKALRSNLLEKELDELQTDIDRLMQPALEKTGATIVSDGWTNTTNHPLLNVLVITPGLEVFTTAIDTSGERKFGEYIAEQLIPVIEKIGPDNVVHVVMDNAANCKVAGRFITARFPWITCSGCVAHGMDLALEDVGKEEWVSPTLKAARDLVKFITNHHKTIALFRQHSDLELLKPGDTRFATSFITLERLLEVKDSLRATVGHPDWTSWAAAQAPATRALAEDIQELVFTAAFWKEASEIAQLSIPIVKVLRLADCPAPTSGKMYKAFERCREEIEGLDVNATKKRRVLDIFEERRKFVLSDLLIAGYVLDPEFRKEDHFAKPEVAQGFVRMLEKLVPDRAERARVVQQLAMYRFVCERALGRDRQDTPES